MGKSRSRMRVSRGPGPRTISKVMALTKVYFLICKSLMMTTVIPLSREN